MSSSSLESELSRPCRIIRTKTVCGRRLGNSQADFKISSVRLLKPRFWIIPRALRRFLALQKSKSKESGDEDEKDVERSGTSMQAEYRKGNAA